MSWAHTKISELSEGGQTQKNPVKSYWPSAQRVQWLLHKNPNSKQSEKRHIFIWVREGQRACNL